MRKICGTVIFILIAILVVHLISTSRLSREAREQVFHYFHDQQEEIKNKEYLTVIDFSKPSYVKRMYIFNLKTGQVKRFLVAHGENTGYIYATEFSNEIGSHKSSRGFFITGEEYNGKHGRSLRLHGREEGINDNAFRRDIVIHGADWVSYRAIFLNGGRLGRSWGCPAVSFGQVNEIVSKLKGGNLLYIYGG